MSDPPDVTVVIPARDATRFLPRTLAALDRQDFTGRFEVVVVDNGSLDDTAAIADAHPGVRVVRRSRGAGPGPARNDGAAAARGAVLAFTDSDCEPTPGWLGAVWAAIGGGADIVQGRVEPEHEHGPFDRSLWIDRHQGLFQTANLAIRAEVFAAAGGFPAGLEGPDGAPFGEDTLLGWAAVRNGARVVFAPDALVRHEVQPRTWRGFVAERRRAALFPPLVGRVPELRADLHRRWFLTRRSARFDLATAGVAAAVVTRRPGPLLAALPYLRAVAGDVRRRGPAAGAVGVAADAVGAVALVRGSLGARTLVL